MKRFCDLLLVKSIAEWSYCLLYIYSKSTRYELITKEFCQGAAANYWTQFYSAYVFPFTKFFYSFAYIIELLIYCERLFVFYNKKWFLTTVPPNFFFFLFIYLIPYYSVAKKGLQVTPLMNKHVIMFEDTNITSYLKWFSSIIALLNSHRSICLIE
jgi:hypothetical protein